MQGEGLYFNTSQTLPRQNDVLSNMKCQKNSSNDGSWVVLDWNQGPTASCAQVDYLFAPPSQYIPRTSFSCTYPFCKACGGFVRTSQHDCGGFLLKGLHKGGGLLLKLFSPFRSPRAFFQREGGRGRGREGEGREGDSDLAWLVRSGAIPGELWLSSQEPP